ncbi:MAG: SURF1 family protein [Hyphomicrobiaceae bacterium]
MAASGREDSLVWPTLATLVGFAVLMGLGTWQMQRKSWKDGLIARIAARVHAAPVSISAALAEWRRTRDVEYLRVRVHGRFRHDEERRLYAIARRSPGWHVLTPLETGDGVLFVNRGFVPLALEDAARRLQGQPGGEVEIVGFVHVPAPAPGWFAPPNDRVRNRWYWLDLNGLAATLAEPERRTGVLPFVVAAEARPENPGGWPKGGTTRLDLPNDHLQYALTWYGLGLALTAVYGAFVLSRLRNRRSVIGNKSPIGG